MKILCFLDSLDSGGAQRQLATIAVGLKKRGHQVRFLVYHPHDHFLPLLQAADIPCQVIPPCAYWRRVLEVRQILRQGWADVVLAFLEAPCLYAELARIPEQRWGLVVSERLADSKMKSGPGYWLRQFHRLADGIVTNSHTSRLMLESKFPFLKSKLTTIYNMVDLELFRPFSASVTFAEDAGSTAFRIVVAASYQEGKNMLGVAKALLKIKEKPNPTEIVIDWYGGMPADQTAYNQATRFIAENGLADSFRLHPPTRTIEKEFATASAVGLFSFYEGLPNAICEAMSCGKPIILSNVCDAGNLVRDGENGFLCDPDSPESMANIIQRLASLTEQERQKMGLGSRKMAEKLFSERRVVDCYERILEAAASSQPLSVNCTWPMEIPTTALATVEKLFDRIVKTDEY